MKPIPRLADDMRIYLATEKMENQEILETLLESREDAEAALNAFTTVVADALKQGDKVQLIGFGTFEAKTRGERVGRNPKTGEAIKIAASKTPAFIAGKGLKDSIK